MRRRNGPLKSESRSQRFGNYRDVHILHAMTYIICNYHASENPNQMIFYQRLCEREEKGKNKERVCRGYNDPWPV